MLFLHIFAAALWLGTAATLPFWGRRMNQADELGTVLGIMDTVYVLKCVFIMGGWALTSFSGIWMAVQTGWPFFDFSPAWAWLAWAEVLLLIISVNSWTLLVLMTLGRRGQRSLFRIVPPIGYNNLGMIILVYALMVLKPGPEQIVFTTLLPLTLIILADCMLIFARWRQREHTKRMSAEQFATHYFSLLKNEDMTRFFRLFHDRAVFIDPFATGPVRGIRAIERFFQTLGDQFDSMSIVPRRIAGTPDRIEIEWEAAGVTKNGVPMKKLRGTNVMQRLNGKIIHVNIEFDINHLPPVQRVAV